MLREMGIDDGHPEQLFDIGLFQERPEVFYKFIADNNTFHHGDHIKPTLTHRFFKYLEDKGILEVILTQNIDNLEIKAGISHEKVAQIHGYIGEEVVCPAAAIRGETKGHAN